MFLAYVDECGDPGYNSAVPIFGLATILVSDVNWLQLLDDMIGFRRNLRDQFGIKMSDEIKANHLIHGKGCFRPLGLSDGVRRSIYRMHMSFLENQDVINIWACVVQKDNVLSQSSVDPRDWAWTMMIQRYERFGAAIGQNVMVFPDNGHSFFIRKKLRRMRRNNRPRSAFGNHTLNRDAKNIIEDPNDRDSDRSYFIQFADLLVYAAYRKLFPIPNSTKVSGFDGRYWDQLSACLDTNVNKLSGGHPGIVAWPQ